MKVSISTTVEVTDEQREMLARVLDGQGARKRKATREEFREYIWQRGKDWDVYLFDDHEQMTGAAEEHVADDDDDLIGDVNEDLANLI